MKDQGNIITLQMFSSKTQASASISSLSSGYIRKINVIDDGYNYKDSPIVAISSAPVGGTNAQAVAITSCIGNNCSIKEILLVNPGYGYTIEPTVQIISSTGSGALVKVVLEKTYSGIGSISITNSGLGYLSPPSVTFSPAPTVGLAITAKARSIVSSGSSISRILIEDAGVGYESIPSVGINSSPIVVGFGTYVFNEVIQGEVSGSKSRVKSWDSTTNILKLGTCSGQFIPGETLVGTISSARYALKKYEISDLYDKYEQNDEIQLESNYIIDFSESNLFGNY